jgi:DNA-binding PadR family transcriptional regulator
VKGDLGEILLTLVAGRSSETNGKRLMEDLSRVFGAELSPGTVYPKLHDFEEEDLLERHELVRTKEYQLDDPEACRERITQEMRQHLVLGLFYYRALEDL